MADDTSARVQKIIEVKIQADEAIKGLSQLTSQINVNNTRLQTLANSVGKSSKEYQQLEQRTKALTAEKRLLQKEVQTEVKIEKENEGSLRRLRAELSKATAEYDRLGREERVAGQRGEELRKEINRLTGEIKMAEYETQRYYRNVGNYENAILNTIGLNNRFATSIINITTAEKGVNGAFAAMGASAKAFGTTLMSLMTNPVFLMLAGIVGGAAAFKWFYDYNVGVERATRLTREFTGVTGAELTHLRAEIQATASTYGKEYKEVLEGVDVLMSHFGETSDKAIEIINKGFASGADINGNYLQLIKQYGPVFKDAGFSASQLVALIQQTRSGIFSQQGLEAIKQASARIREMSSGTRQSLQGIGIDVDDLQMKLRNGQMEMADAIKLVSSRLKELPSNSQEVGQVMADVFGRQGKFASQEMIESLGEIETNLDNLKEKAGAYGKALDDNQKATADLEEETAKLFRTGENGWETMKLRADSMWKNALANVIKKVRELLGWFAEMGRKSQVFRTTAQIIVGATMGMVGVIVDMFRGLGAGFKAVGSWIDAFATTWKSVFTMIRDTGKGVFNILTGNIEQGVNQITAGLNNGVRNALNSINTALHDQVNVLRRMTTGFRNAYDAAGKFIDNYKVVEDVYTDGGGGLADQLLDNGGDNNNTNNNGGSSGGKGGGGKNKADKAAKAQVDEFKKRADALIKAANDLQKKALEEDAKTSIEGIEKLAKAQMDAFYKTYGERKQYEGEALVAYDALLMDIAQKRQKAIEKFKADQAKAAEQAAKQARQDAQKLVQAQMDGAAEGSKAQMDYRLQLLEMQSQAELAEIDAKIAAIDEREATATEQKEKWEQMRTAITDKYNKQRTDIEREYAQKQHEIEIARIQGAQQTVGALSDLAETIGEDNKEAAALAKMLAVGEVMLAQAVAIANAIETSSKAPNPWIMIAQIAMSVAAVTSAMAQSFKSLDQAKFATGGYIRGAGTGTSDSIPVRVSNGESIMNANTTAMFGGLLSSLNQLGGGVPIQVQQTAQSVRGEDMLARAVARGVAMLPNPVVAVEDINRGQRQVEVMNQRATL